MCRKFWEISCIQKNEATLDRSSLRRILSVFISFTGAKATGRPFPHFLAAKPHGLRVSISVQFGPLGSALIFGIAQLFVPSSFSTNIFLNHFKHIIAVRVFTEQPQDLLDGLAEHLTAIQHLELRHSHPPTDLSFLFELKQLTRLKLRFQTSSKWISRLFDELPYLINLEIDGAAIRVQSDGQFETQQTKTKKIWQNLDSAIRRICPEEPRGVVCCRPHGFRRHNAVQLRIGQRTIGLFCFTSTTRSHSTSKATGQAVLPAVVLAVLRNFLFKFQRQTFAYLFLKLLSTFLRYC